ncbi:MAG: DUF4139 domain-containing protein [Zavarzinella sp.]
MRANRKWWIAAALTTILGSAAVLTQQAVTGDQPAGKLQPIVAKNADLQQAVSLPISQVILFNSGVAHFTRSGEVTDNARVDLSFQEQDINDLIKSMTLRDYSETGRISAVTYDSRDPIDRTLRSFAIDLNNNPTFSAILNQARGEPVEVTLLNNANQPGNLVGKIVGVEKQKQVSKDGAAETEVLNLWCAEGMRSVKLSEVQRLRFSNPVIENEMRRALETLSLSHDAQKKAVSIYFDGDGKRKVDVGYVIENPIWKTSYRLVLKKDGTPFLQGWAVVENPTDEDWDDVSMALVSGRPISFQMDLYNPLYIERPTVEPELFAGLRPPTYTGGFANGGLGGMPADGVAEGGFAPPPPPAPAAPGAAFGGGPGGRGLNENRRKSDMQRAKEFADNLNRDIDLGKNVQSVATAAALGDYHQYIIEHPVTLGRQKSALLPIVNKDVGGQRVSIYNPGVQAKHPLLGLRFKNTSGMPLMQGPITLFEGSVYAGDSRILDLQKDEERLISYAVDLGMEVSPKTGNNTSRITEVKAVKGIVYTKTLVREEMVYNISNRNEKERTLLIEHANRKDQGFTFVGENSKPLEEANDVFRFQVAVPAKKDMSYTILEERQIGSSITLNNNADDSIRYFINLKEAPESLKTKLKDALGMKSKWDGLRQDIQVAQRRIDTITKDQDRLRRNLRETPQESKLYKDYLKTLEDQEAEMKKLHEELKTLQSSEAVSRKSLDDFLANLSAE